MSLARLPSRIGPSLIAVAAGWAAATLMTLPAILLKMVVNSVGSTTGLLWSLAVGLLIWCAWTSVMAIGGWLFGCLPLIAFVPESLLLRNRRAAVIIAGAFGWLVVLTEFQVWHLVLPDHTIDPRMFALYSTLFIAFPSVTAACYLRLIAKKAKTDASSPKG